MAPLRQSLASARSGEVLAISVVPSRKFGSAGARNRKDTKTTFADMSASRALESGARAGLFFYGKPEVDLSLYNRIGEAQFFPPE